MVSTAWKNLPWPFKHQQVALNRDTNLLKLIAMITMLIDHTGKMFFGNNPTMRIIGRMAFPIYAYCIALGCVYSRDRLKYLKRIVMIGLISQPLYAVALGHSVKAMYATPFGEGPLKAILNYYVFSWASPNIMLTLALGLLAAWAIRERQLVYTLALALLVWLMQGKINYGWRGVLLIVLFYLFADRWWLSLPVMFTYMLAWGMQGSGYHILGLNCGMQTYAMLALPLIYIPTHSKLRINKWVFYWYYPGHLLVMMIVEFFQKLHG